MHSRRSLLATAFPLLAIGFALIAFSATPALADVVVTIDAETLNRILPEISKQELAVPVSGRTLTVRLGDLRIKGFVPTAGAEQPGAILAALTLEVPELGTSLPVAPSISLHVVPSDAGNELEMRFRELALPLPLMRPINVGGLVPPLRFPTDNIFVVAGAQSDVRVRSQLDQVRVERDGLRFTFAVDIVP